MGEKSYFRIGFAEPERVIAPRTPRPQSRRERRTQTPRGRIHGAWRDPSTAQSARL